MSDIFTVVLDLSRVRNEKKDQLYLAMADTTKMKMIYEFKIYIQFLFSLDCPVELFHENVRLPDLEDIRVLSHLDVVQVRPLENAEVKKCEGMKSVSKSNECNEKHGDRDSRPVPGDNIASSNYIVSQENVGNFKSLEAGKTVQVQEVSGFGAHEKAEMICGPSFPASSSRAFNAVEQPKDNLMRKVCNMQENKTFRLGEETGMAENLKVGTHLQNKYYGWYGKSENNTVTGRSHFQKRNETQDLNSGELPPMLKSSTKFAGGGVENKPFISNDLKPGDVNISKSTFGGTMWGPVNLKERKSHELCDREPPARDTKSKSSTGRPDPHSRPCGSHVIPGTAQKPLMTQAANSSQKKSWTEGNIARKPLSMDEALKLLTEAAAERSKTLSGNNPASHNDGKKNQFKGVCKTFKANTAGGSQNFQKGNFKPQTTSKYPGTLDKDGMAQVMLAGHHNKAVKSQCQFHGPQQEMKKYTVNKKAGSGDKSQGNALLKGCEKPDKKQGNKTEGTGKLEANTGALNPPAQANPAQKKKKKKNKTETRCESKTVSHPLPGNSEHFDNHRNDKIGSAEKTETETAPSNPFFKHGNVEKKIVPGGGMGDFSPSESAFLEEYMHSLALNEITKGKDFNAEESAGFEKSPSRELSCSKGDSEPGVRPRCRSPDNPTGIDISVKDSSDLRFPGNDARPDSRGDSQMTDRVVENTEDGSGVNVSNSSAGSFCNLHIGERGVKEDEATSPFTDPKQGKTILGDDTSPKDNKDKSESHAWSPATNRVITLLNKFTDNASVEDTKDVSVSDNGGGGRLVSSREQADLSQNQPRDGFGTEYAGTLPGVGTGSIPVGGVGSVSSGSRCVPTNEVFTLSHQSVRSVKTEGSHNLHVPAGSRRDASVEQVPSPHAGSSGESANVRRRNDSGSNVTTNERKRDTLPLRKECVIAVVMIIAALAF